MKKNIFKTSILAIIFIILIQLNSFAANIIMETKTDKDIYNVGGTVTAAIDWTYGMQATGFTIQYNSTKLSFTGASIEDNFYNISEPISNSNTGEYFTNIVVSWASFEEVDFTNITFTFTTLSRGEANIAITNVDCFADGNLVSPEKIDYATKGSKTIKILSLGDVDLDGEISAKDRMLLNKYIDGQEELEEESLANADVNLDGDIDDLDVNIIQLYLNKSISILPCIYGDVNLDGEVSTKDRMLLNKYINGQEDLGADAKHRADVNLDGLVNNLDSVILTRFLSNWEGYSKLPVRLIVNQDLKVSKLEQNNTIAGFEQENIKVNDLIKDFNNDFEINVYNINGENLTSNDIIGTGASIKIGENSQEENSCIGEYNVIIYGDTTGDGKINAIDALALIKDINNKITFSNEIYKEAGRIITKSPENPTAIDALAIIKHSNGKYKISQSK